MTSLLVTLVVVYVGVAALLCLYQDRLLFYPGANHPGAVAALQPFAWRLDTGEARLTGWLRPARNPGQAPLVLYFGGNAEDVAITAATALDDANRLFVNYRGFGSSSGKPSARALLADALAVHDGAVADFPGNGKVVVIGRSLGSGVAVHLAAQRKVDALVLITPFASLKDVAADHFPWLPVRWLFRHSFEPGALAPGIATPALVLTAGADRVVPPEHARRLAQRWGGPVTVVDFPEADHNNVHEARAYEEAISRFLVAAVPISGKALSL